MAYKQFELPGAGMVTVYKRRGARSLRLTVSGKGEVRVSQPTWLPYSAGVEFASHRADWIIQNRPAQITMIVDGQRIGKQHYARFVESQDVQSIKTRLIRGEAVIYLPHGILPESPAAQTAAHKVAERALKKETEELLFDRLRELSNEHDFNYKTSSAKKLSGRWGSCSNQKHITLNIFLMELPWRLIEYVLLHELIHTKHLNHSSSFWEEFERCEPLAKQLRREIRQFQPVIGTGATGVVL